MRVGPEAAGRSELGGSARGDERAPFVRWSPAEDGPVGDGADLRAPHGETLAFGSERSELTRDPGWVRVVRALRRKQGQHRERDDERGSGHSDPASRRPEEPPGRHERGRRKEVGAPFTDHGEPAAQGREHDDGPPPRAAPLRQGCRDRGGEEPRQQDRVAEGGPEEAFAFRNEVEQLRREVFHHGDRGEDDRDTDHPRAGPGQERFGEAGRDDHQDERGRQRDDAGQPDRSDEALGRVDPEDGREGDRDAERERRSGEPPVDRHSRNPDEQGAERQDEQLHVDERRFRQREEGKGEGDDDQEQAGLEGLRAGGFHVAIIGGDLRESEEAVRCASFAEPSGHPYTGLSVSPTSGRADPRRGVAQSGRAPVSKTGGWGFKSLRPCKGAAR